jgi:hypothetical protein
MYCINIYCYPFFAARAFIARAILAAKDLEQLLDILHDTGSGISDGFSLNVHFMNSGANFYNIEILPRPPTSESNPESQLDIHVVHPGETYSHSNM